MFVIELGFVVSGCDGFGAIFLWLYSFLMPINCSSDLTLSSLQRKMLIF